MVPKIAISYRRSDSQDITGRIFDRLRQHFGKESVFRDIDNIRPGIDFRVQISEALRATDVLLVVVGPKWFGRAKGEGVRINNEADPVRIEVETALQRGIPVIPVLVGNMRMPTTAQLPDGLKDFAYRHAVTVDGGRDFDHHLAGLIRALEGILESKVVVGNSEAAANDQTQASLSAGSVSPGITGEKLSPIAHSPDGGSAKVADLTEPPVTPVQTEIPKATNLGLMAPVRPIGRLLRVGLIVLVALGGLAVSIYVAEYMRRDGQLEAAKTAAAVEAKAAEDARQAASAKAAEDARRVAEAKAADDAQQAASAKAAEDTRKAAAAKAASSAIPSAVPSPSSANRIALVIGNAKYPDADAPLKFPINDARDVADELQRDGFNVEVGENLTGAGMRSAFGRLYDKIKSGSAVLVFFSGFGIQSDHQNFMIPVDAQIWSEQDTRRDGISLETVLGEINKRGAGVKVALVDASRRNPFERRFRSFSGGLAPVIVPNGSLVMFSAALGSVVTDNGGDHSLFVQELLKEIRIPGLAAEEAFNRTRAGMISVSHGEQTPWVASSLSEDFSFVRR
jgi:Caspase domain/TIR domain